MNEDFSSLDMINDPIRLEMNFKVVQYTDAIKFWRNVTNSWMGSQLLAGILNLIQDMFCSGLSVFGQDISIDVPEIIFSLFDDPDLIIHDDSWIRTLRSLNDLPNGL